MCVHPVIDRRLSLLHDKYENVSIDEFDNCDYVTHITDVSNNDLVVLQINARGIGAKQRQLIDLIDESIENSQPDLILISEMWLTPFSPIFSIPGYEFHHLDRQNKKGGCGHTHTMCVKIQSKRGFVLKITRIGMYNYRHST